MGAADVLVIRHQAVASGIIAMVAKGGWAAFLSMATCVWLPCN